MTGTATFEIVAEGLGYCEGPVVDPTGRIVVTSIDHGRVYRIDRGGPVALAQTGGSPNGAALGADGTIFIAQNGGRRSVQGPRWPPDRVGGVQRITPDGMVCWLTRDPISPNDLCFGPDGLLYVTDPTRAPRPRGDDGRLWRVDPVTGEAELLLSVPWFTNGIAFGPDDRLYVAATYHATVFVFDVTADGLAGGDPAIRLDRGAPDGLAFDERGDLLIGAISLGDGPGTIQAWTVDGRPVDRIELGDGADYTNLAFAGRDVIITDSSGGRVLRLRDRPAAGLPLYPFR